ncbi:Ref family recombination enhancement nuclease [Pantoea sp. CCBC3-3-1]|uniref:Ref family recombination enhancement nuclease n=1 Tax=Pantoea sp. CCBC3-3-1 TaxID=2490851 RepID=UPI0011BFAC0C|nr:Ref family recombination enhancement nuclease [Pantoea sp. CCBC3-3-1]
MKQYTEEQIARQRQKKREAAQRAQDKQRTKLASPEYREQIREKSACAAQRQRDRINSPEYRAEQAEKARLKRKALSARPVAVNPRLNPIRSRGSKGRTPTAAERTVMDALGKLPCIACLMHGKHTYEISLHHIDGRTKPGAHLLVLPLCVWHHQYAAPAEVRAEFPWLIPVHAAGNVGGQRAFEALNATENELLSAAYAMARIDQTNSTNMEFI